MAAACKTAVLISGSGTNLQAFIDRVADGSLSLKLSVVFSNRADAFGLTRARDAGIATACISHRDFSDRGDFDAAVMQKLDHWQPELIILAGFMRILTPAFVAHYAGRVLNIHPALLPLYPGLNTHQRVLDAGDAWHGSTVHFVTEELDAGPRILQGRIPVLRGESAEQLAHRVQAVEHQIYPQAAALVGSGRVKFRDGQAWTDGKVAAEPIVRTYDQTGRLVEEDN
ncbi:MAG: phosphoribosylglycinamide formyltransferase [Gammaproteobacteria bacterium]|nr:phosphoribosylglycinamide formyltransferase [Gammaproteobacteria bacterium]